MRKFLDFFTKPLMEKRRKSLPCLYYKNKLFSTSKKLFCNREIGQVEDGPFFPELPHFTLIVFATLSGHLVISKLIDVSRSFLNVLDIAFEVLVANDFALMAFKRPFRYFTGSKVGSCSKSSTKRKS